MSAALADTSIFLAFEHDRRLSQVPEGDLLISVATLTELEVGVQFAQGDARHEQRSATLREARSFLPLPYDDAVSAALARIVAALRAARRRVNLFDAVIAATASAHGLPVFTQDGDFEVIHDLAGGPPVIRA